MHITVTGNLGSGKSTVCKILAEKYQFMMYSTGRVQRELAQQMKMTTMELNQLMRTDTKYDHMIDDEVARISRENPEQDIIFDSRLAWHFVEKSFKVFVMVSLGVAADRVMHDQRGEVEKYHSIEEAREQLKARSAAECVRYKEIYDLNYMDYSNYNLIIDSTYCDADKIAEIVLDQARKYNESPFDKTVVLVSPKRLTHGQETMNFDQDQLREITERYKELPYVADRVIKVKEQGDNYLVLEENEYAEGAIRSGICYVPIEIV